MKRNLYLCSRKLTLAQLKHSRKIYLTHQAYDEGKFRKIIKKPRISSNLYKKHFYAFVKPFYTTRWDNDS